MADAERNVAFCGLFCPHRIRADRRLFSSLRQLRERLEELQVDRYAEAKAEAPGGYRVEAMREYPAFARVLHAVGELDCNRACSDEGGVLGCTMGECAQARGHAGCWECSEFRRCDLLQGLKAFHPGTIKHNLEMLCKHGLTRWIKYRAGMYPWQKR